MDLGATLCTRSRPDCARCPLRERCVAFATGRTAELPVRKPKKTNPEKRAAMLVIVDGGQVLLEQRADSGIWGGLLSLPEVDGHAAFDDAMPDAGTAAGRFGAVEEVQALLPLVHVFTHYKLHIHPHRIALAKRAAHGPRIRVVGSGATSPTRPCRRRSKKLLTQLAAPKPVRAKTRVAFPRQAGIAARLNVLRFVRMTFASAQDL